MSKFYAGIFMAVAMIVFYYSKAEHDIVYLFAATWFVIHAVSEKVIAIIDKEITKLEKVDNGIQ